MKPRSDLALSLSALAIRCLLRLLGATWRVRIGGEERLDRLLRSGEPVLISFWHNQSVVLGWFLYRYLHRHGFPITLFASQSRDGEIVSRVGTAWGLEAVRGSTSRGGSAALRKLYRAVSQHRSSPIIAPDGPRGPIHRCKAGVVVLARATAAPVQPFACAPGRAWRLGSWDRMIVPWPFARVQVTIGEPLSMVGEVGDGGIDAAQQRIEELLDDLGREAQSQLADARRRPS